MCIYQIILNYHRRDGNKKSGGDIMNILQVKERAKMLKEKTGMSTYPVGVKFIFQGDSTIVEEASKLTGYRYCQALMEARHGKHVILDKDGIACPAAAAAFGFKPLPEGLKNGKGLIGFGITKHEETGQRMFRDMESIEPGKLKSLYLFPLETAIIEPDIVVIEDLVERLMWVVLAYLNVKGGQRVTSSTAVLQATCVDATIIPYKQKKINLSFGCYGCRNATDIEPSETVLGIPFSDFEDIAGYIEYLSLKAMPNSRSKSAYITLKNKTAEKIEKEDIFQTNQNRDTN
jgi:uncharacterized protein (DUF169 family)